MSHAQPAARLVSRAAELLFYAAILDQAVAGLVEAGVRFLEALAGPAASAEKSESPPKQGVSKLIRRDPETKRPILAVPLPDNLSAERIEKAVGGLLRTLSRGG